MDERHSSDYPIQRFGQKKYKQPPAPIRRPVWISAANYYILTAAVALVVFLFVWGVFHEGNEESPWIIAGIAAICVSVGAVVFREFFLRNARQHHLLAARTLDYNLNSIQVLPRLNRDESKLSLEKNAAIIKGIQKKSEAARGLGKISNSHLEVFEVCNQYLLMTERQMETAGTGSPRLAGFRRGREIVGEIHRYHLLLWAEIEAKSLTQKAKNYVTISEKINTAQEALSVLGSALQYYPDEPQLTESETVLKNFIASIKVSHWIEQAERAAFKGNHKRAVSLYRDALFFLAREDVKSDERDAIAENINSEIESLRKHIGKKGNIQGVIENDQSKLSEM